MVSDCLRGGLAREARRAGDRAVSGTDLGAPVGTVTVCDLGEHGRGVDFPLANVVDRGEPRGWSEMRHRAPRLYPLGCFVAWAKETGLAKVYTADSIPWCGLFMAVVAKRACKPVVESPLWAHNWAKFGKSADRAHLGDILVFRRAQGSGHVGLYVGEDYGTLHVLGGNQSDGVTITRIARDRCTAIRRPAYRRRPRPRSRSSLRPAASCPPTRPDRPPSSSIGHPRHPRALFGEMTWKN